jgi:hypothetical protein
MRACVLTMILLFPAAALAAGPPCGDHKTCATAACCRHTAAVNPAAIDSLDQIPPDQNPFGPEQFEPEPPPSREFAKVMFYKAVKVGDRVLMGPYVIEHDNARMAHGKPCTYIYKAADLQLPVVAFRCRHLHRAANGNRATVTLRRGPDASGQIFELVEYQFARSADGHGVP